MSDIKKTPTREELLGVVVEIDGERHYTYKQLAAKYNVSVQTIFNWAKSGRLAKTDHLGITLYREVNGGTR